MGLNTFEHKCMNHIDSFFVVGYFFVIMEIDIFIILKIVVKIFFKNYQLVWNKMRMSKRWQNYHFIWNQDQTGSVWYMNPLDWFSELDQLSLNRFDSMHIRHRYLSHEHAMTRFSFRLGIKRISHIDFFFSYFFCHYGAWQSQYFLTYNIFKRAARIFFKNY